MSSINLYLWFMSISLGLAFLGLILEKVPKQESDKHFYTTVGCGLLLCWTLFNL